MVLFPNCKINLGLHILQKRKDGFHDLETIFYPVPLQDAIEIIQAERSEQDIEFTLSGLSTGLNTEENICVKAYRLLKKDFPALPPVKMHLHKTIPIGAGLGGGSADGAFTLLLVNKKFNLQIDEEQLLYYAALLGSDCPFFIKNAPCYATGRGEMLEELHLDLSVYKLMLIHPGIHIPTAWAFSRLALTRKDGSLKETITKPVATWKDQLENDFEAVVFPSYPEIENIKKELYKAGAVYASLTGTGSTVYGIFEKGQSIAIDLPSHYSIKEC